MGLKNDEYDVIIIGAGIGGLTCGCYLAKAGLKVLIVEQHHKAGGCCTSFKRKGFTFDATTHYLGGFRENGILRKIYDELELNKKVEIIRFDPTNVVIFPEHKIRIWNNLDKTVSELQENFKDEADNIKRFFKFICDSEFASLYVKLKNKNMSFENLLDSYFKDHRLKAIFGIFLANIGLPPSRASAFAVVVLFREFIFDGGYFPKGGAQAFSDAFVERFKEWGGEIILGEEVQKIVINGSGVRGVVIDGDKFISSKKVVSNGDATNTFIELVGKDHVPAVFECEINNLEVSPSAFIVYLGLNTNCSATLEHPCTWSYFFNETYNIENAFAGLNRKEKPYMEDTFFCFFPSSHDSLLAPNNNDIVTLMVPAIMTNNNFWSKNKNYLAEKLIKKAENLIPNLSNSVIVNETATPLTINKYTLNRAGGAGWASTPLQIYRNAMPSETFIKGFYLVGHWVTQGVGQGGISTVAYCGKNVASSIIKNLNIGNTYK